MRTAFIWLVIFAITVAETLISTWEGRADRQATMAKTRKYSLRAAHWASTFEAVLFIDILVITREGWHIIVPILLGAWLGKYWAVERRRQRWHSRPRRPRRAKRLPQPSSELTSGEASSPSRCGPEDKGGVAA